MKPSKKYYLSLLERFRPEEILVVGDNQKKDLNIPHSLGMKAVLVEKPEDIPRILEIIDNN
jgi:FMN phosphatase YigB (HAD superfamily)